MDEERCAGEEIWGGYGGRVRRMEWDGVGSGGREGGGEK